MKQQTALTILESGSSVLLTGEAGSGKTYVLKKYIKLAKNSGKVVAVTATTGLAATHLSGTTIHAWSGIGVHDTLPREFFQKMSKQRRDVIKKTDILIIDEISMLHDFRLDMINEVCKTVRENDLAFGGIQVVLAGDFFQLPPVSRNGQSANFITNSISWREGNFVVCYLQEQHRQKQDSNYTAILSGIRKGFLTRNQLDKLQDRRNGSEHPWKATTRLLTTNADVDFINQQHLNKIDAQSYFFSMFETGGKQYVEQLKKSCLAQENLELKIGAHVMCIKNSTDKKYVNGSLGIITDFEPSTNYPVVSLNNGVVVTIKPDTWELIDGDKKRASLSQLPLRLAWAITIHKSQGMTLDAARIDLSNAFVEGMGYVALSRVRSLENLILDGLNGMALRVSQEAKRIDQELREMSSTVATHHSAIV